jgi:hypothetical protein
MATCEYIDHSVLGHDVVEISNNMSARNVYVSVGNENKEDRRGAIIGLATS